MNKKWSRRQIITFLEQLSLYISAGLPIDSALQVIGEHASQRQSKTIAKMLRDVESGAMFSRTFTQNISSKATLVGIIEQGEKSGELGQALRTAQILLERGDELSKKCLSALAYPLIIGVFATLLTIGLVRGVMPQIIPLLTSLNVKLPLLTRVVIAASEGLMKYGLMISGVSLLIVIVVSFVYRKSKVTQKIIHYSIVKIPLVGSLVTSYSTSIFLRSCGSLIESGTGVFNSYTSASSAISIIPFRQRLESYSQALSHGSRLSIIFKEKQLRFPPHVPALVSAGESSGSLGSSLIRAADIIDRDIEHILKRLTSLIEPTMMAGMGCVVGAIALSIMMPIYDISKVLQR